MAEQRDQWNSRIGFLFAAVGSAIGLGNIWRFSYMCYDNGGAAFLIPYFAALIVAGIPLMILEYGFGHAQGGSAVLSMAKLGKRSEILGWFMPLMVMYIIMLYYSVVIAWCLNYMIYSFNLGWGENTGDFFAKEFLQLSKGPGHLGNIRFPIFLASLVVWVSIFVICVKKVSHGIERACKVFMPVLFLLTAILVIWGLQLDGAVDGLRYYLKPDWSKLAEPKVWTSAFGQIFFSLSLGFGIMIAYASYLPKKAGIVGNAYLTSVINCGYSFFAGFAVFSVLGFMAQAKGVPVDEVVANGAGLAFVAYPQAINLLPGLNSTFGVIFFLMLAIAGISSGISIIEALGSAILDKFPLKRVHVITGLCVTGLIGSMLFSAQGGVHWLEIFDGYANDLGLVMAGLLECIIIGWIMKTERLRKHINDSSSLKVGILWDVTIKYLTPILLFVLLVVTVVSKVKTGFGEGLWKYHVVAFAWIILIIVASVYLSARKWPEGRLRREHSPRGGKLLT